MICVPVSVTLTQLRSFLAVVRSGSVTAAADELVVTQPSVSAAITALSREVGTPLLERDGRGVRPTPAGDAFAPYATDVIGLLEKGRQAAREAAAEQRARAADRRRDDRGRVLRPRAHAGVRGSRIPTCGSASSVGNRGQVLDWLAARTRRTSPSAGARPTTSASTRGRFARTSSCWSAPPTIRSPAGVPSRPRELGGRTWLLREPDSGTRSANEEFLSANALHGETLTVGSNGAIRQAARIGLGISFLSADAVTSDVDAGLLGVDRDRSGARRRARGT